MMLLKSRIFNVVTFIAMSVLWPRSSADDSSVTKMKRLLETRQKIINELEGYIDKEQNRLKDVKMQLERYTIEHERVKEDRLRYVGNPINAFTLIKRLTSDLEDIEERINKTTEFRTICLNNATTIYPNGIDLDTAAMAVNRVQKMYKIKIDETDNNHGQLMTVSDCHKLGVILYIKKDYENALKWEMKALRKLKVEGHRPSTLNIDEIDIMEHIVILHHHLSDYLAAVEWAVQILALDPENTVARKHIIECEDMMFENRHEEELNMIKELMSQQQDNESENEKTEPQKES